MPATQPHIHRITNINASLLGSTPEAFLENLGGPAFLQIPGADPKRYRVIVTLLHGNEPSGLRAIHQMLTDNLSQNGVVPATDLGIVIASVDAALYPPVFSHRHLPAEEDLNRCFAPPFRTPQEQLAANILSILAERSAEAIIDTHNTSSFSLPFAVTTELNTRTRQLASRFAEFLVVLDQPMGTLLEYAAPRNPIITVEFGSFLDPNADVLAQMTLREFILDSDLDATKQNVSVVKHPLRLETSSSVDYSSQIRPDADLTIISSIDQLNFKTIPEGQTLGWYPPETAPRLVARALSGINEVERFFTCVEGVLRNKVPMTLFMATTDPEVANSDCMLYFCPDLSGNQQ